MNENPVILTLRPGGAPHNLRRICAKLCRQQGANWSRSSTPRTRVVQTPERYLGTKQGLVNAPDDGIEPLGGVTVKSVRANGPRPAGNGRECPPNRSPRARSNCGGLPSGP